MATAVVLALVELLDDGVALSQIPGEGPVPDTVVEQALATPELETMAAGLLDTIGARPSGSPGDERAEAWAVRWFRRLGFDSVWAEPVPMPIWHRGETEVAVVSPPPIRSHRIVAIAYGYSPSTDRDSVPLIDVGRGEPGAIEALGGAAAGAAILTDVIDPAILRAAVQGGAVALMRTTLEPGRLPRARVAPVEAAPAPIPIIALSYEDGLWLRRQRAAGPVRLRLHVRAATTPGAARNVVAEWRGHDPGVRDEVMMIGGHLDAWDLGDGALDNGTGVLTAMAAAAAMPMTGRRPARSVRVVLFTGEELGLRGSREYVRAHVAALQDIVAMMNLDMVGTPQGYGATGHPEADTLFDRLVHLGPLRPLDLTEEVDHGGGAGSDHQPFLLAGVPTIYVRTSLPPEALRWYHNAGDTYDKVDFDDIRAAAGAAAAALWALADHPGRPLRHLTAEETRKLVERLGW